MNNQFIYDPPTSKTILSCFLAEQSQSKCLP